MILSADKTYVQFSYTVYRWSLQSYPPQSPQKMMSDATGHLSGERHTRRAELSSVIRVTPLCLRKVLEKFFLFSVFPFSEASPCPDVRWLRNACGKRGKCLKDPYLNDMSSCKCLPGYYYHEIPIASCIGTESNIPFA